MARPDASDADLELALSAVDWDGPGPPLPKGSYAALWCSGGTDRSAWPSPRRPTGSGTA